MKTVFVVLALISAFFVGNIVPPTFSFNQPPEHTSVDPTGTTANHDDQISAARDIESARLHSLERQVETLTEYIDRKGWERPTP